MANGWLTLGRLYGAPVRVHWSVVLGAAWFSQLSFAPGLWFAYAALILIHEAGHAALARSYKLTVVEVAIHGMGGHCRYAPAGTPLQESVIAWGGIFAQILVFAIAYGCHDALSSSIPPVGAQVYSVLTTTNL